VLLAKFEIEVLALLLTVETEELILLTVLETEELILLVALEIEVLALLDVSPSLVPPAVFSSIVAPMPEPILSTAYFPNASGPSVAINASLFIDI
jgi:hypothetical protein